MSMKRILTLLAISASLGSVQAFAGSWADNVYVTADIGTGTYSASGYTGGGQTGVNSPTATTERLAVGYAFNQYFATEVGYTNFGSATVTSNQPQLYAPDQISGDASYVAVVGSYPFNSSFSVFAKVGAANDSLSVSAPGVAASASATNFMYGVGAKYNFTQQWSVHAEYDDMGKTTIGTGSMDLQAAMVGVGYTF